MTHDSDSDLAQRMYRIDRYTVPKTSLPEFLTGVRKMAAFLRTLPGLVRSFAVEAEAGPDKMSVITIAEWDSVESIRKAVVKVREMHQQSGTDRQQNLNRLGVTAEQSEYKPVTG
jgi:heme-degrading monooxygenase HmoA